MRDEWWCASHHYYEQSVPRFPVFNRFPTAAFVAVFLAFGFGNLPNEAFFAGFDFASVAANTAGIRPDARFCQANAFLASREIRLMARLIF